ncbi:MAG: ATP-binding protein [Cetobacterium sp.]
MNDLTVLEDKTILENLFEITSDKRSYSGIKIINDILEKNFAISQIITTDYYSLETLIKENIKSINRSLIDLEDVYLIDAVGLRFFEKQKTKINGETVEEYQIVRGTPDNRPDLLDQTLMKMISSPIFGLEVLKQIDKNKKKHNKENPDKSRIVIIKDFDLRFTNRKEQIAMYHKIEADYDFLARTNSKIIIVNKNEIKTLGNNEAELDIIKYTFDNTNIKRELMQEIKESYGNLEDLDIEYFLKLTSHLTFVELENIIKDGFESTKDLIDRYEKRKIDKIMEANPEIKITMPEIKMEQIIGMENAKNYVRKGMEKGMIKSVALLGPGGTGKTLLANGFANYYGVPMIEISLTDTGSELVSKSERNAKRVFQALETIPEAIILMDELEKQIGSAGNSRSGDGGTGTKVLGELLKFLQNRKPGKNLFIATVNNVKTIQQNCPELLRSGRVDTIMYVDYPDVEEIDQLIDLYAEKYNYEGSLPNSLKLAKEKWTGAEIDNLFRMASMLDETADSIISQGHISNVSKKYDESHKEEFIKA